MPSRKPLFNSMCVLSVVAGATDGEELTNLEGKDNSLPTRERSEVVGHLLRPSTLLCRMSYVTLPQWLDARNRLAFLWETDICLGLHEGYAVFASAKQDLQNKSQNSQMFSVWIPGDDYIIAETLYLWYSGQYPIHGTLPHCRGWCNPKHQSVVLVHTLVCIDC